LPLPQASTGLVEDAAYRFKIDLRSSYFVGDGSRDIELGINAGGRTVLVMTGYGRGNVEYLRDTWARIPDLVAENLLEAVEKILEEIGGREITSGRLALESGG